MGNPINVEVLVDSACGDLAPLLRSSLASSSDAVFSVIVDTLPIECCVRISRQAGLPKDEKGFSALIFVLQGSDVLRMYNAGQWEAFLGTCEAQHDNDPLALVVVGNVQTQSKLLGAAAAACARCHPWSWCPSANLPEAAVRLAAHATYLARCNDKKSREDGYCVRKQRKCEPSDFVALYRSMLSEIQGVSTRQVANIMGAAPTMHRLMELIETEGPDYPTLSRCSGFGEQRDVGVGVAKLIAQALTAPYIDSDAVPGDTTAPVARTGEEADWWLSP